jgi:hypothetical protein
MFKWKRRQNAQLCPLLLFHSWANLILPWASNVPLKCFFLYTYIDEHDYLGVLLIGLFRLFPSLHTNPITLTVFLLVNTYLYGLVTYQFLVYWSTSKPGLSNSFQFFLNFNFLGFNDPTWIKYDRSLFIQISLSDYEPIIIGAWSVSFS